MELYINETHCDYYIMETKSYCIFIICYWIIGFCTSAACPYLGS